MSRTANDEPPTANKDEEKAIGVTAAAIDVSTAEPKKSAAAPVAIVVLTVVALAAIAAAIGLAGSCGGSAAVTSVYDVGARCRAEFGETSAICPTPHPEIPTNGGSNPSCGVAIVGAGPGGLYTAMRLIETGTVAAGDVCIFEMTDRVGGRVYSLRGFGPNKNLNVDVGAYRTWPKYTPVTQALIQDKLGLSMGCYDETEDPCEKYNIMTADGGQMGFVTFVEEMLTTVHEAGGRFFPSHKLTRIARSASTEPATLHFANGATASVTGAVVLNMAQRPLMQVVRASTLPEGVVSPSVVTALHAVQTEVVTKLYLYYRNAWWRHLNLVSGDFSLAGDAQKMLLKGRYHDGDFRCDAAKVGQYDACEGFLLAVYAHDYAGEEAIYFRRFQDVSGDAASNPPTVGVVARHRRKAPPLCMPNASPSAAHARCLHK